MEGPLENEMQERNVNENHNGVGHPQVIFSDGVGMQKTNGDFEDDGDIGDDENEEHVGDDENKEHDGDDEEEGGHGGDCG